VIEGSPQHGILATLYDHRAATPLQVCEAFTALMPATGAAIVETGGVNRQEIVCATDEVSKRLEALEFALGEGPCIHAAYSGYPVIVPDLREMTHSRWPMFAEAASQTPARARYCFPLRIGVISVGVLDLYRNLPGPLTVAEQTAALECADIALGTLIGTRAGAQPDMAQAREWPSEAGSQRAEIHQATGMVMAQLDISAESSLATLRAYAYSSGQPLDDVARQIVTRQLRFPIGGP
jgi:GAF domain-containing protein